MTRLCFYAFLLLLSFTSCDKDCDDDHGDEVLVSYEPMALGNYWLYQVISERLDGSLDTLDRIDTVKITGQELINDEAYFRYEATTTVFPLNAMTYYRRDSLGYIVDEKGVIYFSPQVGEGILHTNEIGPQGFLLFTEEYQMDDDPSQIVVPAGSFESKVYRGTVTPFGTSVDTYDCEKQPYSAYALGVGLVKIENHFASSCSSYTLLLTDYHIK